MCNLVNMQSLMAGVDMPDIVPVPGQFSQSSTEAHCQ